MRDAFKAVRVTDRVYWVGAVDWNVRDFHGYLASRGTTYNAYLIIADRVTLVDTVKAPFRDEMLSRISSVIDPARIDYVVSNHAEMDHSGCLPYVADVLRPEKIFASPMGAKALDSHFHLGGSIVEVGDGASAELGGVTAVFYETRMLHWPDSMFTYLPGDKLLFSQDAFGMHLATSERFDDEIDRPLMEREGAKYYANILLPLSHLVLKLLEKVGGLKIEIGIIAPDHGPVWRGDAGFILGLYEKWAGRKTLNKAVVFYDTMWGSTDMMARAVADGLSAGGSSVKLMKLRSAHRSDIATELLDAGALVVGSPTLNNNVFPTVADALVYIKGLKPKGLIGAAFGSYGWSGEAVKQVEDALRGMKAEIAAERVNSKYVPGIEELGRCRDLGGAIAARLGGPAASNS